MPAETTPVIMYLDSFNLGDAQHPVLHDWPPASWVQPLGQLVPVPVWQETKIPPLPGPILPAHVPVVSGRTTDFGGNESVDAKHTGVVSFWAACTFETRKRAPDSEKSKDAPRTESLNDRFIEISFGR